jgi:DNA-binding NarL/FixJ family response regulator
MKSSRKAAIMIVDDHAMVREGITELINRETDMTVCCGAASVEEALKLMRKSSPDLVIIDITLDGVSGFELLHAMKLHHPGIPALMMSMHDENLHAERALRAGAKGYIMKSEAFNLVLLAIRQVLRGELFLSEAMRNRMLQRLVAPQAQSSGSPLDCLTDRELEVLRLTGQGLGNAAIAAALHRSIKTIEANRSRIKAKLNLKNNADYVRFAVQWVETASPHQAV